MFPNTEKMLPKTEIRFKIEHNKNVVFTQFLRKHDISLAGG